VALLNDQINTPNSAEDYLTLGQEEKVKRNYAAAYASFVLGIEALPADSWALEYTLTLALYESAAHAALRSGKLAEQVSYANAVLQNATTLLDTVTTHCTICQAYEAQGQYLEAIKHALPLIQQLGVDFPKQPEPETDFKQGLLEINRLLAGRTPASLADLPLMTDQRFIAAMKLMAEIASPTLMVLPGFTPLLMTKQVQTSLQYGNSPESILGYVSYGQILGSMSGNIDKGHEFGTLALALIEQLDARHLKSYATMGVFATIKPWSAHVQETLSPLFEAYFYGIEVGNHVTASACVLWFCSYAYLIGRELPELEPLLEDYSNAIAGMERESEHDMSNIVHQAVLNLSGLSEQTTRLEGTAYRESERLARHQETGDQVTLCIFYLHKVMLCTLFGQHEQAVEFSKMAEKHLASVGGLLYEALFYFYDALARLALFSAKDRAGDAFYSVAVQRKTQKIIHFNQRKMKKWATHAPMNFQHKWDLVEAEFQHHVKGDKLAAMAHYDHAIDAAKAQGYVQEEALANELAAQFYARWGKTTIARAYMLQARDAYARWGAVAKVQALEQEQAELLAERID